MARAHVFFCCAVAAAETKHGTHGENHKAVNNEYNCPQPARRQPPPAAATHGSHILNPKPEVGKDFCSGDEQVSKLACAGHNLALAKIVATKTMPLLVECCWEYEEAATIAPTTHGDEGTAGDLDPAAFRVTGDLVQGTSPRSSASSFLNLIRVRKPIVLA